MFNRLKKVTHKADLPWEVHLIDNHQWNAFTIGGGKVFVYTGLFKGKLAVRSDDELAAILAHEIAHVNARHASEKQGKLMLSKLLDKKLRSAAYEASFTTNQEDEADKYSVIYSALAGYKPSAGAEIWARMHKQLGSDSKDRLHDHPLNADKAKSLTRYAKLAEQYYHSGKINKNYKTLLTNNAVFFHQGESTLKAGEGGGFLALFETLGNAYVEAEKAKQEQRKRGL
ncbi:hypothetical protein CVFO_0481 [Isorropodon fossajaponicum endosymbiont JTNG4]|nr:hypothetical protein CVFO_0481 [Isorropodon fossajaponicum endosymbiont JTNG4]